MRTSAIEREEIQAAAERLLLRKVLPRDAEEVLAGLVEALFRLARSPEALAALGEWLQVHAGRSRQLGLWLSLMRLVRSQPDGPWQDAMAGLDRLLPGGDARVDVFVRTEAAREVARLSGDLAFALARLAGRPAPAPAFGEAATDAVCLHLALAGGCGEWSEYDRLAGELGSGWMQAVGREANQVRAVLAEQAIVRGAYAGALEIIRAASDAMDDRLALRLAGAHLHALLACGGGLAGSPLRAEVDSVCQILAPLLTGEAPDDDEGKERFRRSALLVERARSPDGEGQSSEEIEEALISRQGQDTIEAMLKRQVRWARLTLARRQQDAAGICEHLLTSVVQTADHFGLTVVEMMAYDLRAQVRARYLDHGVDLGDEALADAGRAANLGVKLLMQNQASAVERSMRTALLPVFDRVLELLAERALLTAPQGRASARVRLGRALLDYVEQMAKLALSEARSFARADGERALGLPVVLERVQSAAILQSNLEPRSGVLQYFLVARYLITLAYGRDFLEWHVHETPAEAGEGVFPVRAALARLLDRIPLIGMPRQESASHERDLQLSFAPRALGSNDEVLRNLSRLLLPAGIAAQLRRHRVRHLAIVPHDMLYRAPFGSLPLEPPGSCLGTRFVLSLHPTGALAGHGSGPRQGRAKARLRVGFFRGAGVSADSDKKALRRALGRFAEISEERLETPGRFAEQAQGYDLLYLACHGTNGDSDREARLYLGDGTLGLGLSDIGCLSLRHCPLVVLQSCWTGWITHRREFPAQGFPQAFRDAGAAAVVAPMFPVTDPLCPIFTAVFARLLRILPANAALSTTLQVLRTHGDGLLRADPSTRPFLGEGRIFDSFEYRFTGEHDLCLHGSWLSRVVAALAFGSWIAWRTLMSLGWLAVQRR